MDTVEPPEAASCMRPLSKIPKCSPSNHYSWNLSWSTTSPNQPLFGLTVWIFMLFISSRKRLLDIWFRLTECKLCRVALYVLVTPGLRWVEGIELLMCEYYKGEIRNLRLIFYLFSLVWLDCSMELSKSATHLLQCLAGSDFIPSVAALCNNYRQFSRPREGKFLF